MVSIFVPSSKLISYKLILKDPALLHSLETGIVTINSYVMPVCDIVKLLGLQIHSNLSYASHINYVISRINHVKSMLTRLTHLFDRYMRQYLVSALIRVTNSYGFVYASASSTCLDRLDVAHNDLMRVFLGIRRSPYSGIADLHKVTTSENASWTTSCKM
jgi:Gpi18-like mannosyltransferase